MKYKTKNPPEPHSQTHMPPQLKRDPNDNIIYGGGVVLLGSLFITFALITALDLRYLMFVSTVPFAALGFGLIVFVKYIYDKDVLEDTGKRIH